MFILEYLILASSIICVITILYNSIILMKDINYTYNTKTYRKHLILTKTIKYNYRDKLLRNIYYYINIYNLHILLSIFIFILNKTTFLTLGVLISLLLLDFCIYVLKYILRSSKNNLEIFMSYIKFKGME